MRVVQGEGLRSSRAMIVGEAPGAKEEAIGRPFVGKAGQKLDELLRIAGVLRSRVYVTNVVKIRPPENRTPTQAEVKMWMPHLALEILRVEPKAILALGKVAVEALTGHKDPMGDLVGRLHFTRDRNVPVVACWHPAYLLRNQRAEQQAVEAVLAWKALVSLR